MNVKEKYQEVLRELETMLSYPWEKPEFYAAWLAQSYYYTSRSSRLLLMASAHCDLTQNILHRRFSIHATEEKGHDRLALRDMNELGFDLKDIPELPITTAFYSSQFYKVQNESPESLMGWVLPLEGIAVEFGRSIRDRLKTQDRPTRFLDIHVDEDSEHVLNAFKSIQDLDNSCQTRVLQNMDFTKALYLGILNECQSFCTSLSRPRKVS